MSPTTFPQANKNLLDNGYRSEIVTDMISLPVWTDDNICVSRWQMSWKERIQVLLFGKIWVYVASGSNQPPISLSTERNIFE
jgi:hypothetical protein